MNRLELCRQSEEEAIHHIRNVVCLSPSLYAQLCLEHNDMGVARARLAQRFLTEAAEEPSWYEMEGDDE